MNYDEMVRENLYFYYLNYYRERSINLKEISFIDFINQKVEQTMALSKIMEEPIDTPNKTR